MHATKLATVISDQFCWLSAAQDVDGTNYLAAIFS